MGGKQEKERREMESVKLTFQLLLLHCRALLLSALLLVAFSKLGLSHTICASKISIMTVLDEHYIYS